MTAKHATIADIAEAAGVSKTTVSRFINGQENLVSKPTATRIRKAIERMGYHPSAAARALAGSGAGFIGIAVDLSCAPLAAFARGLAEASCDADVLIAHAGACESMQGAADALVAHGARAVVSAGDAPTPSVPSDVPAIHLETNETTQAGAAGRTLIALGISADETAAP